MTEPWVALLFLRDGKHVSAFILAGRIHQHLIGQNEKLFSDAGAQGIGIAVLTANAATAPNQLSVTNEQFVACQIGKMARSVPPGWWSHRCPRCRSTRALAHSSRRVCWLGYAPAPVLAAPVAVAFAAGRCCHHIPWSPQQPSWRPNS